MEKSQYDLDLDDRFLEMARRGDTEALRNLIEKGAQLNYKDKYGFTALMRASMESRTEAIDFLVGMGANIYLKNNFGLNALMLAVDQNRDQAVKSLLRYDFDLDDVTNDGRTAADMAEKSGNQSIMAMLQKARVG